MSQEKIKFPVKFTPEQRQELETWYAADNCQDRSEFMVKAMEFYIDYLKTSKAESFLPIAITAASKALRKRKLFVPLRVSTAKSP